MRVEYSEDVPFVFVFFFSAGSPVFFCFAFTIKTDVFFPGKKSCLYQRTLITFLFLIIGHYAYKMARIIPIMKRSRLQWENIEKKLKTKMERNITIAFYTNQNNRECVLLLVLYTLMKLYFMF